ncbi:MAG: hypothetical protein II477_01425, partial [Lachnospiraceae bacterium]|nr:hypothetical protein [Lachnospiraceae bacterium]
EEMLRKTWGFDGVVMTDWGGIVHRDIALNHGCDLEMPGMNNYGIKCFWWDNNLYISNGENFGIFNRKGLSWYDQELADTLVKMTTPEE